MPATGQTHGELMGLLTKPTPDVNVMWRDAVGLYSAFGKCTAVLVPGDSFGAISGFREHSLVLDPGSHVRVTRGLVLAC